MSAESVHGEPVTAQHPHTTMTELSMEDVQSEDSIGSGSCHASKSKDVEIHAKVAILRVKQEKLRYIEECRLLESEHHLLLQKQEDEAERLAL